MLIAFAVLLLLAALVVFLLIALANGMSDAPQSAGLSLLPAALLAIAGVACLIVRFFLR